MLLETDNSSLYRVVCSDLGRRPVDSGEQDPIGVCNRASVELQEDANPEHLICLVEAVQRSGSINISHRYSAAPCWVSWSNGSPLDRAKPIGFQKSA